MNHRHLQAATVLALGVTVLAGCTSQEIAGEAPSSAVASVSTPAAEPTTVQNVTVPDVTGKDAESARSVLVAAGFAVDTTGDGTVANGTTPGAGALVAPGSKVTVILVKPEADGTRENPFPAGTTLSGSSSGVDEATLTIGPANWEADAIIAKENQFNDPAGDGNSYVLVPVTITNIASEEAVVPWLAFTMKYVSPDGRSFDEASVVIPSELSDVGDLYKGGVGTGNVAFAVPKDARGGLWVVSYGFSSDEAFVQAS